MAHFIEVYDDGGRKQIVDEPIDLSMIKKLEAKPEDDYYQQYSNGLFKRYFYRDPLKTYEALVAIQPSVDPAEANKAYIIISRGVGVQGYHPHPGVNGINVANSRVTFYYYSWLPQPVPIKQKFGLEVYNESGEISWASYNTSMNILDVLKESDFRYAGGDLYNYFTKNYGHKNVAIIPISMPYYQENNVVYDVGFSFNEAGALRVYKRVSYRLSGDDIDQGWDDTIGYRLEFLVVDVRSYRYIN